MVFLNISTLLKLKKKLCQNDKHFCIVLKHNTIESTSKKTIKIPQKI